MRRHFWELFSIIICPSLIVSSPMCNKDDNCRCYPGLEPEIQCPPVSEGERFVIQIKEQTVQIDCYDMMNFRMDFLPNITLRELIRLEMSSCPLPIEDFKKITDHFQMSGIKVIQFEDSSTSVTLTGKHFSGLDLDRLKLNVLNFTRIDEDAFDGLSNLYSLDMDRNRNLTLTGKLFRNLTNLHALYLPQNRLEEIPEDVFTDLVSLKALHLWNNDLTVIPEDAFSGLSNLTTLDLNTNRIANLSEKALRNLKSLRSVNLSGNRLEVVSGEIFRGKENLSTILLGHNPGLQIPDYFLADLASLKKVDLASCNLGSLPEHTFENSNNLAIIDLHKNKLGTIPLLLFSGLVNLKKLLLQENLLTAIDEDMFRDLSGLEEINLANNLISQIHERVFYGKRSLRVIDLSHNNYSGGSDLNILEDSPGVVELKFGHNSLTKVRDVVSSHSMLRLRTLDLSHNQISDLWLRDLKSSVDMVANLDDNDITTIHLDNIEDISPPGKTTISLKGNALTCSCQILELVQFLQGEKYQKKLEMFEISPEDLICDNPSNLYGQKLEELPTSALTCELEEYCPWSCSCRWRPSDTSIVIDCQNKNLPEFPIIDQRMRNLFGFNQTEVHLEGNLLESVSDMSLKGYNNVTRLYLSRNRIRRLEWLPPKLEILHLDNNQLSVLSYGILDVLNKSDLVNLTLRNNRWICDCKASNLTNFLRRYSKLADVNSINCYRSNKFLINLTEMDLCHNNLIFYIVVPILGVILFFMILLVLFFRYQQEIKIWLFAHDLLLCWVTEEEIDKDKQYDAFISYSHKDENFVLEQLVPVLEGGPDPYKLCLHFRDWIPGEIISQQVIDTVARSRRTVIVLSSNFLESFWGKMEFRTAHMHAMTEGRTRVIIIVYGSIDINKLDEELKAYIKTNTYLKWGDPFFWERLKYALPHPKIKVSKKKQKLANVMNCIDDKFTIVKVDRSNAVNKTSDSLKKQHPLEFVTSEEVNAPRTEARSLMIPT